MCLTCVPVYLFNKTEQNTIDSDRRFFFLFLCKFLVCRPVTRTHTHCRLNSMRYHRVIQIRNVRLLAQLAAVDKAALSAAALQSTIFS